MKTVQYDKFKDNLILMTVNKTSGNAILKKIRDSTDPIELKTIPNHQIIIADQIIFVDIAMVL